MRTDVRRTVLRKCSTQMRAVLCESARTVWSGGGALQEVAAGALSRCLYIIGALSQHYRGHNGTLQCTIMLSQCCNIINMHSVNYHHCVCTLWRSSLLLHYRTRNSTLLHYHLIMTALQYCTIMLSRYCHNVLSQSCASHYLQQSLHCHSRNYCRSYRECVPPFLNGLYFSYVQCPLQCWCTYYVGQMLQIISYHNSGFQTYLVFFRTASHVYIKCITKRGNTATCGPRPGWPAVSTDRNL